MASCCCMWGAMGRCGAGYCSGGSPTMAATNTGNTGKICPLLSSKLHFTSAKDYKMEVTYLLAVRALSHNGCGLNGTYIMDNSGTQIWRMNHTLMPLMPLGVVNNLPDAVIASRTLSISNYKR